jgi:DNA-binding transcriptional MocR family regulator
MWSPEIANIEGPRYLALASAITEAIDSGALQPGAQLPPQRDLAQRLNVTVGTVGRAYNIVKARQLVTGEVGRGTFVRENPADGPLPNYLPERLPGTIDFACYSSALPGLSGAVAAALCDVATRSSLLPLHKYPPAPGFLTHRTAGAKWMERSGMVCAPEQVLVCNGAQQALMVALIAMTGCNDVVLCEQLAYSGIKALATLLDRPLRGVAIDEFGLIPEALEEAIDGTGAKLLYLQPTVHNPTGAVMPEERRRVIAGILQSRNVTAIEDDAAVGALRDRPPPLAHFAPDSVIYVNGLSKCISPALRVAYIASPHRLFERLSNTLHALTLANSPLLAEAAAVIINNGTADLLADRYLVALAEHHDLIRTRLGNVRHTSHPAAFFVWVQLPQHWSSHEFSEAASRAGISVVPADNFTTDDKPPRAVRISVRPTQKIEVVERGIDALVQLMEDRHTPSLTV